MVEPTTPSPPRRWINGPLIRLVVVGLWLGVAALVSLYVARFSGRDLNRSLTMVLSFLPVISLAAFPLLVVAIAFQRKALAAACTLLLLVAAALYGPERGPGPQEATQDWPTMRVLSANLLFSNTEVDLLFADIRDMDLDVLLFQEVTDRHRVAMVENGLYGLYPHIIDEPMSADSMVLSRLPLVDPTITKLAGGRTPHATVETAGGPVQIVNVHLLAPVTNFDVWVSQIGALTEFAATLPRPLVVGDFNATWDHAPFRRLLAEADLTDAHRAAGSGWGATWREGRLFPPLIRIDHALVGEGLDVVRLQTEPTPGSDHRHLVLEVAIQPSS